MGADYYPDGMRAMILLASALAASSAWAQTLGSCEVGTAQAFLDVSDVRASVFTTGGLFFGGSTTFVDGYLVPKRMGNSPIGAATVWLGGTVDGEVRTSSARWGSYTMWPGPLNDGGTLPSPIDCSAYDRIWTVSTYDVAIYDETGVASLDLTDWPVGLGAPAVDASGQPVVVTSREQTLELATGERPVISGTQTAFWVMNDTGNESHRSVPLGVEVAVTAFAIVHEDAALNQGTYYRYTVSNRNSRPIIDARFGLWVDLEAGGDYVGSDTTRGMAFGYNKSNANWKYDIPPAVGFDFLDGLGSFRHLTKANPQHLLSPRDSLAVYHALRGLSNGGAPIREGDLNNPTGPITRFMYAGDPVTESFWSELNTDENGSDGYIGVRWILPSSPRFDLLPGESKTLSLAVLFAQGADHLDSITQLRAASDRVQAAYDDGSLLETTATTPLLASPTLLNSSRPEVLTDSTVTFEWNPVPDAEIYRLELSRSESFADTTAYVITSPMHNARVPDDLIGNEPTRFYWRVRAETNTRRSPYSSVGQATYYRYIKRPLLLSDGSPAIVEVAGPGGVDPCGSLAQTRTGCDEVGAHLVFDTPNSTGVYSVEQHGIEWGLRAVAPHDFEIRMGRPSFAGRDGVVYKVPYQVWDIGIVAPGEANDPSDDIQLYTETSDGCPFRYRSFGAVRRSSEIDAYYVDPTYDALADHVRPAVEAAPNGCASSPTDPPSTPFRFSTRPTPIFGFQFVDLTPDGSGTFEDLDGVVIRLYTADPFFVADESAPRASALTLGPAYPNPTASALTVPYRLASSSPVELAVFDVLGRRVIELVKARQIEGAHTAELNASTLAPGVYVVRLRAGDETRTTRITVVR
ncbi:MAG: hypothetical protein Rubg2KO_01890 [Rubricoccaceae bacterium]